jgi:outer membrane protein OmpA-like peptidoglycan-associated protein
MKNRLSILSGCLAVAVLWSQTAAPQRSYQQLMEEGEKAFSEKNWEEAATRYREAAGRALDMKQSARARYRVAQAYEGLGDKEAALLWYRDSQQHAYYQETAEAIKRLQSTQTVVTAAEIVRGLKIPLSRSQGVEPSVDLRVHFETNQDALAGDGPRQVAELAAALADPIFIKDRFVIVGHTDQRGSDEYNINLSKRRAQRVVEVLSTQHHVQRARLEVKAMGKAQPISQGETEEDYKLNRRVEVRRLRGETAGGTTAPKK